MLYICLTSEGGLIQVSYSHYDAYRHCTLCPRKCGIDRTAFALGACKMTSELTAARAALHYWEEPCISGERGSGAVFFSGCSLGCVFCQNHEISSEEVGFSVTDSALSDIFLRLQDVDGANNINLVTAAHFVPHVVSALERAKAHGLKIPVVYNSSGYESVETLKMLDGLIDVYLPDMKYFSSELSHKYSRARDYFDAASSALDEMFRQVGEPRFAEKDGTTEEGIMLKGMIVRHLILPGCTCDSKKIIKYLFDRYSHGIFMSIMNQYTPVTGVELPPELTRCVTDAEYDDVVDYACALGVENGFIQEGGTVAESFIPIFNGEGII